MVGRVPVLRQDHGLELIHQPIDAIDNFIAFRHRKRAAWTEIILDVDDNQGFVGGAHHGPLGRVNALA
ncbi:MAG: hypothetical protein O9328_13455 [Rhodobacteraceae bacterium]|nr:hypothetical protein [Paracoccaceae bacterium]